VRAAPEEHPALLTEALTSTNAAREKTTQIMFESFGVPLLRIVPAPVLAMHASNRLTGVVSCFELRCAAVAAVLISVRFCAQAVDCGEGLTHTVPVVDGYAVTRQLRRLDVTGADLTDYMLRMLSERGSAFTAANERDIVRHVKETLC
jgi:actin